MFKLSDFLLLGSLLISGSSFASYRATDCSNGTGTLLYSFQMSVGNDMTDKWTFNGEEISSKQVKIETLGRLRDLSSPNGVQGSWTVVDSVTVTYDDGFGEREFKDYVICTHSAGI